MKEIGSCLNYLLQSLVHMYVYTHGWPKLSTVVIIYRSKTQPSNLRSKNTHYQGKPLQKLLAIYARARHLIPESLAYWNFTNSLSINRKTAASNLFYIHLELMYLFIVQ